MSRVYGIALGILLLPAVLFAQTETRTTRPFFGPVPPNHVSVPQKESSDAGRLSLTRPNGRFSAVPARITAPPAFLSQELLRESSKKIRIGTGEEFVMKFIYRVSDSKVFPLSMSEFQYHFDYALVHLDYKKGAEEFNKNYIGPGARREFVAGSLILKKDAKSDDFNRALFELWTGDLLDSSSIQKVMRDLLKTLPSGVVLQYHPLSEGQEAIARSSLIPKKDIVFTSELFANRTYLALNEGEAIGIVKFVRAGDTTTQVDLTDIAVYEQAPNDIGLVGAVVTAEPQTLLSHINVKSINRRTANMYLKDVFNKWKRFEGKAVRLKVGAEEPTPEFLKPGENFDLLVGEFWEARKPKLRQRPEFILDRKYDNALFNLTGYYKNLIARKSRVGGLPTREEHRTLTQTVGAKAANLGLLNYLIEKNNAVLAKQKLPGAIVPETVAIPFNFYEQFLTIRQAGLEDSNPNLQMTPKSFIEQTLRRAGLLNEGEVHPISQVAPVLAKIRKGLSKAQLPPKLLALLKTAIMENEQSPIHISKHPRLRFRSSTSAEDMDGFTGAGLYDSGGVSLYEKLEDDSYDSKRPKKWDGEKGIESKIKELLPTLYASIWNDRAFTEREWFSLSGEEHLKIKAGLAVHGAFPLKGFDGKRGEMANGVGITTNTFNPEDSNRIFINAQHYDLAVTNPPTKKEFEDAGVDLPDANTPYSSDEYLLTAFLADDFENQRPDSFSKWPVEKFRSTSIKPEEPIFKPLKTNSKVNEVNILGLLLKRISDDMAEIYGKDPLTFFIDTEWKIYGEDRKIFIKQARPFEPPVFD